LFFANVDRILNDVRRRIIAAAPPVGAVIISLEETFDLDSSTIEALLVFFSDVAKSGKRLVLARLKYPVLQLLGEIARTTPWVPQCSGLSVDDAVRLSQAKA
jgi:MFS superfamily sulfate permease-like transporter